MPKLLLVKHSISNHNPDQPPHEWGLTTEGIQRCKVLATHIAPYHPQRLFASTMPKALHTAQLVAQELGDIAINQQPLLQEHSRKSNAPYGTAEEFQAKMRDMLAQPDKLIFGDETADEAQARFGQGIVAVMAQCKPDENIVVIAHGTVNVLFTARYNAIDRYKLWQELKLPSIIVLDVPSFTLDRVIADAGMA